MSRAPTNGEIRRKLRESAAGQRLQSAGVRAQGAYAGLRRHAERLSEELDEVTAPHGVKTIDLDDEDSMVVAVVDVIAINAKS